MDDEMIIFSNEPLQPSQETVTLPILSEERVLGTDLPQRSVLEGQITLDPRGRIFFIPLLESSSEELLLMPDRKLWDLYLVYLPFTLHPAPGSAYYEELTFFIELVTSEVRAYDLFPAGIVSEVEETQIYMLSPQITFKEASISLGQISKQFQFKGLHPTISAFGKDESRFYWIHQGFKERKAVFPEAKHAAVILKVPYGTPFVEGNISYEVRIVKKRMGSFRSRDGKVKSFPVHWPLLDAPPLFEAAEIKTRPTEHFDVCIVCALAEEALSCIREIERLCSVAFQAGTSARSGEYRHATIQNRQGIPLSVRVSWQLKSGLVEAGLHIKPVIEECTPYFVAMTGICAGDKRKVKLGDLIVATSAFAYDTGKIIIGQDGKPQLLRELDTWNASPDVVQFARMFQGWESGIRGLVRPPAKDQADGSVELPAVHIAPVASGHTVRSDNPFEEISSLVRNTTGIDMEAVAFYRAAAEFPGTRALLVKGVSDYADGEKNDNYHEYASTVSAAYMIGFIQEFVHADRFPLKHS